MINWISTIRIGIAQRCQPTLAVNLLIVNDFFFALNEAIKIIWECSITGLMHSTVNRTSLGSSPSIPAMIVWSSSKTLVCKTRIPSAILGTISIWSYGSIGLEQLPCKQQVVGSSPTSSFYSNMG